MGRLDTVKHRIVGVDRFADPVEMVVAHRRVCSWFRCGEGTPQKRMLSARDVGRRGSGLPFLFPLVARLALVFVAAAFMSGCGEGKQERTWTRLPSQSKQAALRQEADELVGGGIANTPPAAVSMPREAMGASGAPMGAGMPGPADRSRVVATTGTLVATGIGFMIPEGWQPEPPSTPMRLAQYRLAGSGGDAELTVFAFGPGQGGSPKANIERWVAQFRADESTTASQPAEVAELETGGLRIYLVKTSGTYSPTAMGMMGPPAEPRPNYALFGVVVEGGPEGLLFIKVTGPKATLEEQNARLEDFVRSVKKL